MRDQKGHWKIDLLGHLEDAKILALSIQDATEDEEIENHRPYGYDQTYEGVAKELSKLINKLRAL